MAHLSPLRRSRPRTCRLCTRPAAGVLAWPAIVDPWTRDVTAEALAASRRVLKAGDALCQGCGDATSYAITTSSDDSTEPSSDEAWPAIPPP